MDEDKDEDEASNPDRFSVGPGDMWVVDEETGIAERIGNVPEAARRRIEERGGKVGPNRRVIEKK